MKIDADTSVVAKSQDQTLFDKASSSKSVLLKPEANQHQPRDRNIEEMLRSKRPLSPTAAQRRHSEDTDKNEIGNSTVVQSTQTRGGSIFFVKSCGWMRHV